MGDFILHFLKREGIETRFIPRKRDARSSAVLLDTGEEVNAAMVTDPNGIVVRDQQISAP